VVEGALNSAQTQIEIDDLSNGTYFFSYVNPYTRSSTLKFTVIK